MDLKVSKSCTPGEYYTALYGCEIACFSRAVYTYPSTDAKPGPIEKLNVSDVCSTTAAALKKAKTKKKTTALTSMLRLELHITINILCMLMSGWGKASALTFPYLKRQA